MIYLVCEKCQRCLRVSPGEGGEAEFMFSSGKEVCWDCGKTLDVFSHMDMRTARSLDIIDVSPAEALAAVSGVGLPNEQDCSLEAVNKLLQEHRVVRVSGSQIRNSHRSIINYLELDDGTKVYFGSSAYGATVYRVAPRHSYVEANDER